MDFKQGIINAWNIIKFDGKTMQLVAKQENATVTALLIILIAGAVTAVGYLNPILLIGGAISSLIGSGIWIGLTHLLAKLFGGQARFVEYYRTSGHYYLLGWIGVIPAIGPFLAGLAGIYQLFVAYAVVKNVHGLSPGKSALVIILPIILVVIIALIFAASIAALIASIGLAESGIAF